MNVTKELVCINLCFWSNNVSKWKHDYYRHSVLYLYYCKFRFQNGQTIEYYRRKLGLADTKCHAEPDTSSRPYESL